MGKRIKKPKDIRTVVDEAGGPRVVANRAGVQEQVIYAAMRSTSPRKKTLETLIAGGCNGPDVMRAYFGDAYDMTVGKHSAA